MWTGPPFLGQALGRPMDPIHPGQPGNYRMLETPPDEPIVQIQRVDHEAASTRHRSDDIVRSGTLDKAGRQRWSTASSAGVMEAPAGQRFGVVEGTASRFPRMPIAGLNQPHDRSTSLMSVKPERTMLGGPLGLRSLGTRSSTAAAHPTAGGPFGS